MFHILSPVVYALLVLVLKQLLPVIPENKTFLACRRWHNIVLSLASLAMLLSVAVGTVMDGKMRSVDAFLCKKITNILTIVGCMTFAWSKYYEWMDTVFLILGGKKLEPLHLIHHGITALVVFSQIETDDIGSHSAVFVCMNTFIHF